MQSMFSWVYFPTIQARFGSPETPTELHLDQRSHCGQPEFLQKVQSWKKPFSEKYLGFTLHQRELLFKTNQIANYPNCHTHTTRNADLLCHEFLTFIE